MTQSTNSSSSNNNSGKGNDRPTRTGDRRSSRRRQRNGQLPPLAPLRPIAPLPPRATVPRLVPLPPQGPVRAPPAPAPVLAVQKLYETCKEVFANCGPGIVPTPENVERLRVVLDEMKPNDVELNPAMHYFSSLSNYLQSSTVTYLHLYECDKFSIGIFCLPPNAVIPLHNHPGMTVFSKLLFGDIHIKAYDWVLEDQPGYSSATSILPKYSN